MGKALFARHAIRSRYTQRFVTFEAQYENRIPLSSLNQAQHRNRPRILYHTRSNCSFNKFGGASPVHLCHHDLGRFADLSQIDSTLA